jgi:hypothetical protein
MDANQEYVKRLALVEKKLAQTAREIVDHPEKAWDAIQKAYPNVHTRANMVCALWMHIKGLNDLDSRKREAWLAIYKTTCDATRAVYDANVPSERQVAGTVPYSVITSVRDALPLGSPQRLLLGMYTHIDPLRNDFHTLEIFHAAPEQQPVQNYIVLGNVNMLYLEEYKTAKTYKTLTIPLPKQLVYEINVSLKLRPRKHVFVMKNGNPYTNEHSFCTWANVQLKKLMSNPDITLTMLRHIHITEHTKDMTLMERRQTARNMGHSVIMQLGYTFKP